VEPGFEKAAFHRVGEAAAAEIDKTDCVGGEIGVFVFVCRGARRGSHLLGLSCPGPALGKGDPAGRC